MWHYSTSFKKRDSHSSQMLVWHGKPTVSALLYTNKMLPYTAVRAQRLLVLACHGQATPVTNLVRRAQLRSTTQSSPRGSVRHATGLLSPFSSLLLSAQLRAQHTPDRVYPSPKVSTRLRAVLCISRGPTTVAYIHDTHTNGASLSSSILSELAAYDSSVLSPHGGTTFSDPPAINSPTTCPHTFPIITCFRDPSPHPTGVRQ